MPLFTKQELDIGWKQRSYDASRPAYKSSDMVLKEANSSYDPTKKYDIFFSHSYKDKDTLAGLYEFIKNLGYSVYVDWIDDAQLNRSKVTKGTASLLKVRMNNCRCLFYITSENSLKSIWMPWELGYFDGIKNKVAILPIIESNISADAFLGQEYLGIYPYVSKDLDREKRMHLCAHCKN